ncbi:ATP-binding protein [Nonomuraea insulae]|uniref:ATP-binding protein n=1 Tax=Nonomuraea insulae TaxID=1616787 RepID=A0ABW1CSY2_9ACTN
MEFEFRFPISADLERMRGLISVHARRGGLQGQRLEDLVIAVNEAVTNVLDHGGAVGMVIVRNSAEEIVVDIVDSAGRLSDEHLAAAKIDPTGSRGFGLWVIQHLCDRVDLEQSHHQSSRLRLHMRHRPPGDRLPGPGPGEDIPR